MSDRSSVEKGSKVSESEGSGLIAGTADSDLISAGGCCGKEDEEEEDKDNVNQVTSAETMEMNQRTAVNTTKEMMR